MLLRKDKGGSGITYRGVLYEWPADGAVTEVPDELGMELLAIKDGGYSVAVPPQVPARPPAEVTEPAPAAAAEATVTEPAPRTGGRRSRAPVAETGK